MQGFPFGAGVPPGCLGQGPGMQGNAGLMSLNRDEQGCAGVPIPPSTSSSRSVVQNEGQQTNGGFSQAQQANIGQASGQDGVRACFGAGTQMPNAPMFRSQVFSNLGSHPGVGQTDLTSGFMSSNLNGSAMGQNPSGSRVPRQGGPQLSGEVPMYDPQHSVLSQISQLVGTLDANQMRTLHQVLGEQLGCQGRMLPEFFGAMPRESDVGGQFGNPSVTLPGGYGESERGSKNVFAKSENWLGPAPTPEVAKWTSRESEVSGFAEYLMQLSAWASQASLDFAAEIVDASRWPETIAWQKLSTEQPNRSTRLLGILKTAFASHARTAMLISAFCEGVNLHRMPNLGHEELWMRGQASNGFELLRQLTLEYSIKTRSEALSLRPMFSGRTFAIQGSETSATSIVSDAIRKIDLEVAKFSRLISALPASVDTTGLGILDADLVVLLLKSLPQEVKTYCLRHTPGESYGDYRETARRWEHQQRRFLELPGFSQGKKVYEVQNESRTEWYDMTETDNSDNWWYVDSRGHDKSKCSKCGSKKHQSHECSTDMTKVKCCRCHQMGHVSMNCPTKVVSSGSYGKADGKGKDKGKGKNTVMKGDWVKGKGKDKGKYKGKDKSKDKGKGKSKGKPFGKKGKMNEMVETSNEDLWWYGDDSYWNEWQYDVSQV